MPYTEAGLLSAMETAGREIENDARTQGLYRVLVLAHRATRAAIIEAFLKEITSSVKVAVSTDKGYRCTNTSKG